MFCQINHSCTPPHFPVLVILERVYSASFILFSILSKSRITGIFISIYSSINNIRMEQLKTLKSLSGNDSFLLNEEETILLHTNFIINIIQNDKLAQIKFEHCLPVVDTDYYEVGSCRFNGRIHSVLATKENIVAALQSNRKPLMEENVDNGNVVEVSTLSLNAEPVRRIGAFSHYSKHFLA